MVIKSQIFNLLRKYLGEYLYGFTKDQLEIGVLTGEFELINVNFRPHKVNKFLFTQNLPFFLKSGMIGKLRVKFNYRAWRTSPIEIYLEELLLIFGPVLITESENPFERNETVQSYEEDFSIRTSFAGSVSMERASSLDESFRSVTPGIRIKSLEKLQENKGEGFFVKYFKGLLTNLSVVVEKVHVRFEDDTYSYKYPYSMTLLFDSFEAVSSNKEYCFGENGEIGEKNVNNIDGAFTGQSNYTKQGKIVNFALYVTSMSSMMIPTSLWEQTESSAIGIFSALPAYEIRNLLLDDYSNLKSSGSALLSPLSAKFSLSISSTAPYLKVTISAEQFNLDLSNASAECLRNLFEYVLNARLWKDIRKYRPVQRIITEPREDNEAEYLSMLRKEVVYSWFQYAFIFIRAKLKKPLFPDMPSPSFCEPEVSEVIPETEPTQPRSIFAPRVQKVPGIAQDTLKSLVKDYNNSISHEQLDKLKEKAQPLVTKPESFFPKFIEQSEIDFKTLGFNIKLFDTESKSSCEAAIEGVYLMLRITSDELTGYLTIESVNSELESEGRRLKLVEMGKTTEEKIRAVEFLTTYRPGENGLMLGTQPILNFIDVKARMDELKIFYSHLALAEILGIFESFKTDSLSRDLQDIEYMQKIEQKRSTLTWKEKFVKKNRQIMHGAVFKKIMMAKKLIRKLLQWQSQLKANIKSVDSLFMPFLFDIKIETTGIRIQLMNKDLEESSIVTLPSGLVDIVKEKDYCKLDFFGFGLITKTPFKMFYKYVLKISENMKKGIKRIKNATLRISLLTPQ